MLIRACKVVFEYQNMNTFWFTERTIAVNFHQNIISFFSKSQCRWEKTNYGVIEGQNKKDILEIIWPNAVTLQTRILGSKRRKYVFQVTEKSRSVCVVRTSATWEAWDYVLIEPWFISPGQSVSQPWLSISPLSTSPRLPISVLSWLQDVFLSWFNYIYSTIFLLSSEMPPHPHKHMILKS